MSAPSRSWLTDLVLDNPIVHRAAVPRMVRRASRQTRLALACSAFALSLSAGLCLRQVGGEFTEIVGMAAVWAWAGMTVLLAALETSKSIGQERIQGTWEMLVLTRLGGRAIVAGKLLGVLLPLWAVGLVLLPFCLVLIYAPTDRELALQLPLAYGVAVVAGTASASLGLYCSLRFHTILAAQLGTVIVGWFATNLLPAAALIPYELILHTGPGPTYFALYSALALAPGYVALALLLARFDHLDRRFREARA